MRKFLIPIVAAVSAVAVAAPASAQWAPPVYHYQPYNYGNAFSYRTFARSMEVRVQRISVDIRAMQASRILSWSARRPTFRLGSSARRATASSLARRAGSRTRSGTSSSGSSAKQGTGTTGPTAAVTSPTALA